MDLSAEAEHRLKTAQNIWVASVRPDGRPHLVPVWFTKVGEKLYISIERDSVKGRNISQNPQVILALEDGLHPVICEGTASPLAKPWREEVLLAFQQKYEWDINTEGQYNYILEVTPQKWLVW